MVYPLHCCTNRRKDLCPSISRWMDIACIWPFLLKKASCNMKIKEANIFYLNSVHPIYRVILLCRLIISTPGVQNWCLHTSWAYGALFYTGCVCRHRVLTRPVNRLWWTNTVQHLLSPESHRAVLIPLTLFFFCARKTDRYFVTLASYFDFESTVDIFPSNSFLTIAIPPICCPVHSDIQYVI